MRRASISFNATGILFPFLPPLGLRRKARIQGRVLPGILFSYPPLRKSAFETTPDVEGLPVGWRDLPHPLAARPGVGHHRPAETGCSQCHPQATTLKWAVTRAMLH